MEHPSRRSDVEKMLDKRFVKWQFVESVDLNEFDDASSLRNQARLVPLQPRVVESYAAAMERGDDFPAVIAYYVGTKLVIVDGNHRFNARKHARMGNIPVYVIEASDETIAILTYEANTRHGLPTSEEERQRHAIWLMDNGATKANAAQITGLTENNVGRAWAKEQVERRARSLGIRRGWDKVTVSGRLRLGQISTDDGFKAAAQFAIDAGLSATAIDDLVTLMNKTRSGEAQVEIVSQQVEIHREAIQQSGAGILNRNKRRTDSPRIMMLAHLGYIRKIDVDAVLRATDAEQRKELAQQAYDVADTLLKYATRLEKGE